MVKKKKGLTKIEESNEKEEKYKETNKKIDKSKLDDILKRLPKNYKNWKIGDVEIFLISIGLSEFKELFS